MEKSLDQADRSPAQHQYVSYTPSFFSASGHGKGTWAIFLCQRISLHQPDLRKVSLAVSKHPTVVLSVWDEGRQESL